LVDGLDAERIFSTFSSLTINQLCPICLPKKKDNKQRLHSPALKLSKQNSNNYDAIEQKKKEFKAARKIQEITHFLEKILDRCRNYLNIRVTLCLN